MLSCRSIFLTNPEKNIILDKRTGVHKIMKKPLMNFIFTGLILATMIFLFCDKGASPTDNNQTPQVSGVSGTVYYKNWPSPDSLKNIRLIVFKNYPPTNIVSEILSGQAVVYPALGDTVGLPFNVDSTNYEFELDPGTYAYFVVGWQYGANLYNDWLAAGEYDTSPGDTLPTPLVISKNQILKNIYIQVNFDSLPYQPF